MAYIGRGTDSISNVEVLDNLTFDGSASYTLQKSSVNFVPSSANNLLISISGVVQQGNFSVSGSTITFDTTVSASDTCDWILHYGTGLITTVADGAITEAKLGSNAVTTAKINDSAVTTAKLNDASVSLAKLSATGTKDSTTFLRGDNTFAEVPAGGITEADQWRLTANKTSTGDITANLERVDTAGFGYLGTGMTESSGIFSFPSTGIYKITANIDGAYDRVIIKTTTDNSTYVDASHIAQYYGSAEFIFDVTSTSTHKVKFNYDTYSTGLVGDTAVNRTHFTFIRLGDT